ncbi:MAG: fumarylacetoacetate hydrolase family protein [bacterium]
MTGGRAGPDEEGRRDIDGSEAAHWAATIRRARAERRTIDPISAHSGLTLSDAYAVQRAGTAMRLAAGERIVGWKLGYTSLAMREQMRVTQPNFGPLTDAMLLATGSRLGPQVLQPRVEPEIAVRLAGTLPGCPDRDAVAAAVGESSACLEVVDSVYTDYRFTLEDNTADGSSAAFVVLGPPLADGVALDEVRVRLLSNGVEVDSATGAAASGHPLGGVVWLAAQLATRGQVLEAGDVIITGGLTRAVPLAVGGEIRAVFSDDRVVSIHR